MHDEPRFGPAGAPQWFKELRAPTSDLPHLLQEEDLNALEYEAVRWGCTPQIKQGDAERLGKNARKSDVWLTIHGSYYVNLLSKKETLEASKRRLIACAVAAKWMNAHTIVFHTGYYTKKQSHKKDLQNCIEALKGILETMQSMNIQANLGPETAGKLAQLGSLGEILTICEEVEQTQPVIDWAHLHARQRGGLRDANDFQRIVESIENRLGTKTVRNLHCHFSHVEYTFRGERRHHSLNAHRYGPKFESLADVIINNNLHPVVISESPLLDVDAKKMRNIIYQKRRTSFIIR